MNKTAPQYIKLEIILWGLTNADDYGNEEAAKYPLEDVLKMSGDEIDDLYDELDGIDSIIDGRSEIRGSYEAETNLQSPYSRHYESKEVAAKMHDGTWVGWTYWYGGGKHGEPEAMDWIEDAYLLECKEEEMLVVRQTFEKV